MSNYFSQNKSEWKKLRKGPPTFLDQLEQMFCNVAVDGSSSCIPGEEDYGMEEDDEDDGQDGSPMSISTRKRASSTATTATSPMKKTKSPMVKVMKELTESMKADSASTQKVLNGDLMAESMKKCQQLAVECGASEETIEYFMACQLFVKAEQRQIFLNISTNEARFLHLKRWCQMKNMYSN